MKRYKKSLTSVFCCLFALSLGACNGAGSPPPGSGGGFGNGSLSIRTNIAELSENVDNVPYFGEIDEGENAVQSASATATLIKPTAGTGTNVDPGPPQPGQNWGTDIVYSVDVQSPEDDPFFSNYANTRQYFSPCAELYYIGGANNVLDFSVKYLKDGVLETVTMLNRWIRITDNVMRRLRYDQLHDVLSCEEMMAYDDYFHYQCTTSSYTADGKEIVEFVEVQERAFGCSKYAKYFRYVEDKEQLYFTVHDDDMYGIVYSDLTLETPLSCAFSCDKSTPEVVNPGYSTSVETITKEIFIPQTETDCGFAAQITSTMYDDGTREEYLQQTLIDRHGLDVGKINASDYFVSVSLNLPFFDNLDYTISFEDGLDRIRFEEDLEYASQITDPSYQENVLYTFSVDGQEITFSDDSSPRLSVGMFCSKTLEFNVDLVEYDDEADEYVPTTDPEEILTVINESGLGMQQPFVAQVERFLECDDFLNEHSIYGHALDEYIGSDAILKIFMQYADSFTHISESELQALSLSNALPSSQQTVDDAYYDIYDVSFTGTMTFDDTDDGFALDGIVATMPQSLGLNDGDSLALVAVYTTGCETYELKRQTFTYTGEDLTMSFDAGTKAYIPEIQGEGQIAFYVINLNNLSLRISEIFTAPCDANTVLASGSTVKRLFTKDGVFFIRQANLFTTTRTANGQTIESPVDFIQSLTALLDDDYAVVTVLNGTTPIAEFSYDFDRNVEPRSVTVTDAFNADTLIYTLTIYDDFGVELFTSTF